MIEHLLPAAVRSRAAYGAELDGAPLFPEEAAAVAKAVARRRAEYAAGRACARAALAALGYEPGPIPRDPERGAPVWPDGVVGSITHCDGYRAAAVARTADVHTLGIDAEPHGPLPDGVLKVVTATAEEGAALERLGKEAPDIHWDRLLFSAKETVYKAWYPFHRKMLDFKEAELLFTRDRDADEPEADGADDCCADDCRADDRGADDRGGYTARLLIPGPLLAQGVGPAVFTGRWIVRDGFVVTAIVVPNEAAAPGA